jgi:hypothetical protein
MNLPPKIPKPAKRATRWRSPAHTKFVRSHACSNCGSMAGIDAAHVRLGSHTGMGQKPSDDRVVSLCRDCHSEQHRVGEATFWRGRDVEALIAAFCAASPKRNEIAQAKRERGSGA